MVNHFQPLNTEIRKYADLLQSTNFFQTGLLISIKKKFANLKKNDGLANNIKKSVF